MKVLGISAGHRDAAAAVVVNGTLLAAAAEERFSRRPRDADFPIRAIRSCLRQAGVLPHELDRVVFYEKPLRKFERVLATQMQAYPRSCDSFATSAFTWLGDRLWIKNRIAAELGTRFDRIAFTEHQAALAASAFFTAPCESAALLTVDDVGEWATAMLGVGAGRTIEIEREILFPHSLGLVVSAFTQYLGFVPGHDEDRIEMLAAYGSPTQADALREIVGETAEGFTVDQRYFRYAFDSELLFSTTLTDRFGPARKPGDPLLYVGGDTRHADLAASVQLVVEERVMGLAARLRELVQPADLCFGGEIANNRGVLRRLVAESAFRSVHVAPDSGKAGGAIGAALSIAAAGGTVTPRMSPDPRLGEAIDDRGVDDRATDDRAMDDRATDDRAMDDRTLDNRGSDGIVRLDDGGSAPDAIARRLLAGQKIAWVRGRMEFGPDSIGNRCILAAADAPDAGGELLAAVQRFEPYLRCRVAIPAEQAETLLEFTAKARELVGRGRLPVAARPALRAAAPSALAPDGTVRALLVDPASDPTFHALLTAIGAARPTPVLLFADYARRGATIPRNEPEAIDTFRRTRLDALVVDDRIYE